MFFTKVTAFLEKNSLPLFYLFLAAAIFIRVVEDLFLNRWGIHSGTIFPYRHPNYFPLYSNVFLVIEWTLLLAGAALLLTEKRRWGAVVAALGMAMSLSQMLQNQKILLLWVLLIVAFAPPENSEGSRWFLRWQIVLVYVFAALSKIFAEFSTGATLAKIFPVALTDSAYLVISWIIIVIELLIPILLLKKRQWAWLAVVILHGGFSLFMRDLAAFTLTMFALTSLFYNSAQSSSVTG
ncbi:MAG: hypothetical protein ACM3MG_06985 [Bacillota bacterium]